MTFLANHIRSSKHFLMLFVLIGFLVSPSFLRSQTSPQTPEKAIQQSKKSADVLARAMANPNQRIPKALLEKAVAVAVLPDAKKVSLLIEGAGTGRGVVSRRAADGKWSPPAFIRLGAMSIGPQLKSNSFDVIMLFMNNQSAAWLLTDKAIVFDRTTAPVAGPVGEIRSEDKQVIPVADTFAYVFDEGRLQGKDLKNLFKTFGLSFDNDLNKGTYGVKAGALLSPDGPKATRMPSEVTVFSDAVTRIFAGNQ